MKRVTMLLLLIWRLIASELPTTRKVARSVTTSAFLRTNSTDELIASDCPSSKQSKSILSRALWSPNAEPFHLVKQRSAFQSKPGGHAARPPELPVGALTRS